MKYNLLSSVPQSPFSPVVRIGTPTPSHAVVFPPFGSCRGRTCLRELGLGGLNSDEGTDTVVPGTLGYI
jgi:hypothetical protein